MYRRRATITVEGHLQPAFDPMEALPLGSDKTQPDNAGQEY